MPLHEAHDGTLQELISQEGAVLVDFGAAWCPPCRRLHPVLEELDLELGGTVPLLKVNADDCPESVSRYGVMSLPTVIIFRDGQPVKKLVGLMSKEAYKTALLQE